MIGLFATYALVGAVAGVLAGLFGIGGGLVIVPMLDYFFTRQGIPGEIMMHLALGTSLGTIVFTAVSSFMAHHRRGAVDWGVVKGLAPGIVLGTLAGAWAARFMSTAALKIFFVVFIYYVAYRLLAGGKPKPGRQLPGPAGMFGMGNLIGVVSSWVGIGGGTLSVPFMIYCNVPAHTAVGTSAALGFFIALAGSAGYVSSGLGVAGLPEWSLGFMYLPALAGIAAVSVLFAPLGVRLAHSLPVDKLKRWFGALLILVATRMAWKLFF